MVKLISRVHEKQFSLLSFVVVIGLVVSIFSPSPFVNFTVLLISMFALSGVMPTDYSNLRIVYAFAYLAIGFGLYLRVEKRSFGMGVIQSTDPSTFQKTGFLTTSVDKLIGWAQSGLFTFDYC